MISVEKGHFFVAAKKNVKNCKESIQFRENLSIFAKNHLNFSVFGGIKGIFNAFEPFTISLEGSRHHKMA